MPRTLILLLLSAITLAACSEAQSLAVQDESAPTDVPATSTPANAATATDLPLLAETATVSPTDTETQESQAQAGETATNVLELTATDPEDEEHEHDHGVDLSNLPIGDAISSAPEVGSDWSCTTDFRNRHPDYSDAGWIHDDGTYDFLAKLTVDGEVVWPSEFEITLDGGRRIITGNNLPDHPTGDFPITPDDEAYAFDRNPNAITEQDVLIELPATPVLADEPSCLRLGPVGVLLTGGYFFNALDAAGYDAVAYEIQDDCQGHPMSQGAYHYHNLTTCIEDSGDGHSALVGYALDGFGIYGHRGENGETLTNADLDVCHGHTHDIEWDGEIVEMYHYHATWEYPYTVGCFRG